MIHSNTRLLLAFTFPLAAVIVLPLTAWADAQSQLNRLKPIFREAYEAAEYHQAEQTALEMRKLAEGPLRYKPSAMAYALTCLARAYLRQGRFSEAEPLYKRVLAIRQQIHPADHPQVAIALSGLADLYSKQGRHAEAESLTRRSLALTQRHYGPNHREVASTLNDLGLECLEQGRYAEGELFLKRAIEIRSSVLGDEDPDLAPNLNNLATLYMEQGRHSEAEPLLRKTYELDRKVYGNEHPYVALTLKNLASACRCQGRYTEAELLLRQVLMTLRGTMGENHPKVARCLNSLSVLCSEQGRNSEAETAQKEALRIYRDAFQDKHPDAVLSLNNLAGLYIDQGRFAEAEPLLDDARKTAECGFCNPLLVARIYRTEADLYWQTDRKALATSALEKALRTLEQQRTQVSGGELERAEFFGNWTHWFELMVSWQHELTHPDSVLNAMERARARTLLDQMEMAGMELLAGLPQKQAELLRSRESEATARVAGLRAQLDVVRTRQELTVAEREKEHQRLASELRQAQLNYVQTYADLRNASPTCRLVMNDDQQPVGTDKVGAWLDDRGALLLEYLLGADAGYVYVHEPAAEPKVYTLELSPDQAATLEIEPGPLTAEKIRTIMTRDNDTGVLGHLRASHNPHREKRAEDALEVLWYVLIPETQREAIRAGEYEHLVVLADASLVQLPFETLVVESSQTRRILLDVGPPVLYAPSATVLMNLVARAPAAPSDRPPVLTVGAPQYGIPVRNNEHDVLAELSPRSRYRAANGHLQELPFTEWETNWVSKVFTKNGVSAAKLVGEMATERNVRFNVSDRRVVHFACHGLVDESYGNLFGALALTPGPKTDEPADDGLLTLAEIYELDLDGCELAILSACDTNTGPEQRGEGVWALSRGFLVAGARRVVASNWLVDDEAAASLISYFCSIIAKAEGAGEKPDYAEALWSAKRWVRNHEKWKSPYYWAPFVLVGPN